jgi:HAD superfamily phosphoserine phosphatase-like hydrolase
MSVPTIKLAAFDIDGTLSTGVLSLNFLQALVDQGLFSKQVFENLRNLEYQYSLGKVGREEMSALWLKMYLEETAGKNPQHYSAVAEVVWKRVQGNTFSFVGELMEKLTEKGFQTLVISASPREIVSYFCFAYNITPERFRATSIKINEQGLYLPEAEVVLSLAQHKLDQLNDLVATLYPDQQVDWSQSLAMGDSYSDVEMLRAMGKPVVLKESNRETSDLEKIAQENQWTVVNEVNALEKILELVG